MLRRALLLFMVMLIVPNLASAYNVWSTTRSTSPSTLVASVAPPANVAAPGYTTSGNYTYATSTSSTTAATAPTTMDYTVNAAPAGYTLAYVMIDGVKYTAPNNGAFYRVSKGAKINHTISAVYVTAKYTITTSKSGNGYIDPTAQVAAGASKTINITPGYGSQIADVLVDGGSVGTPSSYTFSNVQAPHTIAATFTTIPTVDAVISTLPQTIVVGSTLTIDGSASTSSVTPTWTWTTTGGTVTPVTVDNSATYVDERKTATFSATAAGTYTVTLTLDNGATDSATVAIAVITQADFDAQQCTSCHNDRNPNLLTTAPHGGGYPMTATGGTWTGTAWSGTTSVDGKAQYFVGQTCSDCHSNHFVNASIYKEFATSSHGDVNGPAWIHYNWKWTAATADVVGSGDRTSCVRCHTTTGFIAKLGNETDTTTKVFAANNGQAGEPQELLGCKGCHTNNTGALRTAGAFTVPFTVMAGGGSATLPDVGKSNLCVRCHAGRASGAGITSASFTSRFPSSHYLDAAGTLNNIVGYHFTGSDYTGGFHKTIGGTGDGPCVTCHMSTGTGHTWNVVTKDGNGAITAVTSTACVGCHTDMNATTIEASREEFHVALDALKAALETYQSAYYNPADGKFYTTSAFTTEKKTYTSKDALGAAYNYYVLDHADPAAYVHNAGYAKKLIVDSIDILDNAAIDLSAGQQYAESTFTHGLQATLVDASNPTTCNSCHSSTIPSVAPHGGGTVLVQAQYVAQNTTCADCHADTADLAINKEWAESGHGDVQGEAWWHYDWTTSSRATCQRCHTSTGFINNMTGSTTALVTNVPGQVLSCNSCHSDVADGVVRDAGAWTLNASNGNIVSYAAAGKSSVCVRCHSARETGNSIKLSTGDFTNLGFINSHYLAAAGTVFSKTGYEFDGQSYANVSYFKHNIAGIPVPASVMPTDDGPCVTCHMGSGTAGKGHTFEVVKKDANGVITAINSTACGSCHTGAYTMTVAVLNEEKEGLHASLEAQKAALVAKGIYFWPAYPYFYKVEITEANAATAAVSANAFKNWDAVYTGKGKDVMGAAFNFNLLEHEAGAYAHNRYYAKRLIFDSIDFLDNGVLDGVIDLTASPAAAAYLKSTAPANAVTRP